MIKLNLKLTLVFIFLVLICFLFVANKQSVMMTIKEVLDSHYLNSVLWTLIFCCFFVHYVSIRSVESYENGLLFKHFGKFADAFFAIVTYGVASTTSAAILKGVYIQQFLGGEVYFNYFDQIDIYSMLIVCAFLLGYSLYAALSALINAIMLSQAEEVTPVGE